ncbi:MAG: AAA family ATPase [Lachnospiraceae bacterium]|nr:AAA family ATPase [Lachnospiraceae bacterium]
MESKLKLFEITNLFNQFNVNLPLDEKVNIFLGENGMGKTTILNCLYYVLSGNIEKLNNIIFDSISLTFVDGEKFSIDHNDISSYVEDYMYGNPPYRRRKVQFESLFTIKELENISKLIREGANEEELKKYYFRVCDVFGMPPSMARRELERYIVQQFQKNITTKADFNKVITFKKKVSEKIDEEILYFPTYRRIEEDMSNLGIDIEKDRVKSRLIQFGMTDVEKNIEALLQTIKSVAITGFAKMTGVLLKQYSNGELSDVENYKVEQNKLVIALARIGDEIEEQDKQRIIELVNSLDIYNSENRYLLNLIKNLIDSYERQNKYDERVKTFTSICNNYLNGKKYIYDETNVELGIYKEKTKKPISIQNLSSGEKQIISVFSKLYIENIENCIILFDEPELSLSIKWQNMFLPDVVNSEKCSTLIAVTHSPFIFDNEFDDLAKDMGNCLSENE